ncbi:aldehyde dehydrogenase family protein [candidate division KSB1 bacterium]|nr:aldehyde dehydrogenase family protein [candidate division KSB1 bacterium]
MKETLKEVLQALDLENKQYGAFHGEWLTDVSGKVLESVSPINGQAIGSVKQAGLQDYQRVVLQAGKAFKEWQMVPAPRRGEVVMEIGLELRKYKEPLGKLVTLEMGKILTEGLGEVQEMIDVCAFATGLSRQLYGLSMHSERPMHRMYEQWHPLGVIGIISAFNFPVAVWAWNMAIAAVCGNSMIWKPSSKTPLTAIACTKIAANVLKKYGMPDGVISLVIGSGSTVGEALISDTNIPLISATGSTRMGKRIGEVVGARLGRTILELGGNNAIIITPSADLDMALRTILFGAVGTAGQRCTTTRRIIIHHSIYNDLLEKLVKAYNQIRIGNPLDSNILMGPLVDESAIFDMQAALEKLDAEGGKVIVGGKRLDPQMYGSPCYVTPCIAEARNDFEIVQEETFAPILYAIKYSDLEEAIAYHNGVPQGLSSSMFSTNLLEIEEFLSHRGSDCGIANINIGTSGAEIGGAFGGEKDTGGGRECGSDAWKYYMRRQTNTINWSKELPLAQGVVFDL